MKLRVFTVLLIILLVASCTQEESKESTQAFINGLSATTFNALGTSGMQIINDLPDSVPGIPPLTLSSGTPEGLAEIAGGKALPPNQIDTLYGTWHYYVLQGWIHTDTLNPSDGIKYEWDWWDDSTSTQRTAYILVDSLEFYMDSLPENIHMSVGVDDTVEYVWVHFDCEYVSLEEISSLNFIFEIVSYYQFGASINSATVIDEEEFEGSVHLWVIDYTNNEYRVDFTLTAYGDDSYNFVLEDSDEWKVDVDISEIVEVDTVPPDSIFVKRNIDGEITHAGNHAADIEGHIWEPTNEDHPTEIIIIYTDGTEESLLDYELPDSKGSELLIFKPW